jgi:hypothetical protein
MGCIALQLEAGGEFEISVLLAEMGGDRGVVQEGAVRAVCMWRN